jgi:hypothetical protein
VNSQSLNLDEIITLRGKNIAEVEEFLSNKKCKFISAKEPDSETMGNIIFAFNKSDYDDKAEAFIIYRYSDETSTKRLSLQINKIEIYNSFMDRIKNLSLKLINSKIKDGEIVKTYQGKTTTIEVSIANAKNDYGSLISQYFFFIVSNQDYNLNLKD